MRIILLLLIMSLAWPSVAQKTLGKGFFGGGVVKQALNKNLGRDFVQDIIERKVSGIPKVPVPEDLERYVLSQKVSFPPKAFPVLWEAVYSREVYHILSLYKEVLNNFTQFKKEMDTWLYYQSKPSEQHVVSMAEQEELGRRIMEMNAELAKLKRYVSSEDEAYHAACEYMLYVVQKVNPLLRGMMEKNALFPPNRKYQMEEFFLHNPRNEKESSWNAFLPLSIRAKQISSKLPKKFKIAVVNDKYDFLDEVYWNHKKLFVPDWQITTYDDAQTLLQDVNQGSRFDVILTDIVVPGGGFYLTVTLRKEGFKGAIIALSAFQEKDLLGKELFEAGFDGMISVPIDLQAERDWPLRVMQKLHNYFYYRHLYNWTR